MTFYNLYPLVYWRIFKVDGVVSSEKRGITQTLLFLASSVHASRVDTVIEEEDDDDDDDDDRDDDLDLSEVYK